MNIQSVVACIQSAEKSKHRKGEVDIKSHFYPRNYLQLIPAKKNQFTSME